MAAGRKKGIKAAAQDNFIAPDAPTIGAVTNVGTGRAFNNGSATVAFTAPTTGNTVGITSYTATSSPGGFTGSGASSPITVTGLQSNTAYTFTVTATNAFGTSSASSASSSITATTVPATPAAPTITSVSQTSTDIVTWVAPATGGSAITGYTWASNDSKTGSVGGSTLSANVAQEAGTEQTYNVYATNANGNSSTSSNSTSFTSFSFAPFSFTPFSPFSFTPFSPFSFTPFSPFGFTPFGFTPFGFTPFGFTPFSFAPFGPSYSEYSVARNTGVLTVNGRKPASELQVGDKLHAMNIPSENVLDWTSWQSSDIVLNSDNVVETEIVSINVHQADKIYSINGDLYSESHYILTKKDNIVKFTRADQIDSTYSVYSYAAHDFEAIISVEAIDYEETVYSINCEPYDNFFTDNMLVFDTKDQL